MTGERGTSTKRSGGTTAGSLRFGPPLMERLQALAAFTEVPGQLTRRYLSPSHIDAARQVGTWMAEAGMSVRTDPLLSVFGRYEGRTPGAPAIMLGSHIDTVVDAGLYDGNLGVLAAIAAVAELRDRGERLHHAIEVAAFGEEEGSRFPTHILTSSALIGAVEPELLDARDADGITVREALARAGSDAEAYRACARKAGEIAAFLELHIEQGPVLEARGAALAAVTAINGSVRSTVTVTGFAGHAGTVPMGSRRDALAAASEMILTVERIGASAPDLVATVGRVAALPGAQNVIPGRVTLTIDMRSPSDTVRDRAHAALVAALGEIAGRRGVEVDIDTYQRNAATALDPTRHRCRRRGHRRLRAGAAAPCLRRRPRRHDHGPALPLRHDLRPLQGRHQPQPGRVDHGGGRRLGRSRTAGSRAAPGSAGSAELAPLMHHTATMTKTVDEKLSDLVRAVRELPDETQEALVDEFADRLTDFTDASLSDAATRRDRPSPRQSSLRRPGQGARILRALRRGRPDERRLSRRSHLRPRRNCALYRQDNPAAAARVVARIHR